MADLPDHIVNAGSGRAPIIKPRGKISLDPSAPELKELTFVRNAWGRVIGVPKWRAIEMINDEKATLSNRRELEIYDQQLTEWSTANPEKKYVDFQNEVLLPYLNNQQMVPVTMIDNPPPPVEVTEKQSQVLEAVQDTNQKLDKLTDAILQLVNKPTDKPKRTYKKKGAKNG